MLPQDVARDPGVFYIEQYQTGKVYIAQTQNLRESFIRQMILLSRNEHPCKPLQEAWNDTPAEFREASFEFRWFTWLDDLTLNEQEDFYRSKFPTELLSFNPPIPTATQ